MVERQAGESRADFRPALHDRDLVLGEKLAEHFRQQFRGARRQFRGLQHDAIAGGKRGDHRRQRQIDRIVPWRDDFDDAKRLDQDFRAVRPEFEPDGNALRLHPSWQMPQGVARRSMHRPDFRQQGLVARPAAEIFGDGVGDGVGLKLYCVAQAGEVGAALVQRRRAFGRKGVALTFQDLGQAFGSHVRKPGRRNLSSWTCASLPTLWAPKAGVFVQAVASA